MGRKTKAFEAVVSDDDGLFEADRLGEFDAVVLNNCNNEIFLPEHFKIVSATPIGVVTTNGGMAFDVINIEQAVMVWLVAQFLQDVGHATTIQPVVGINVAAATAITFTTNWWRNANMAATDTLVAIADATACPCTAAATD